MGFSLEIKFSWDHAIPFPKVWLIVSVNLLMDFLEGFVRSLPLYLRKFQPRKSKPSLMFVIRVLSSDSSRPRSLRKTVILSLISLAISSELAVTMKSSQYLMKLTFVEFFFFFGYSAKSSFSRPSNVILAKIGEMSNNRMGLLHIPSSRNRTWQFPVIRLEPLLPFRVSV